MIRRYRDHAPVGAIAGRLGLERDAVGRLLRDALAEIGAVHRHCAGQPAGHSRCC